MKTTTLFTLLLLLLATSCTMFQKPAEYAYRVTNPSRAVVVVEAQLANPFVIGSNVITETIGPGETRTLWIETGEKGDWVMDIEMNNTTISPFQSVYIKMAGVASPPNYIQATEWQYTKEKSWRATYTLPVKADDFQQ